MDIMGKRRASFEDEENETISEEIQEEAVEEKVCDIYDPEVKAAAIQIVGGKNPEEACANGVDVEAAKVAAAKILSGSYFA